MIASGRTIRNEILTILIAAGVNARRTIIAANDILLLDSAYARKAEKAKYQVDSVCSVQVWWRRSSGAPPAAIRPSVTITAEVQASTLQLLGKNGCSKRHVIGG